MQKSSFLGYSRRWLTPLMLSAALLLGAAQSQADTQVYLQQPDDWSSSYIHVFDAEPAGTFDDTQWPGLLMQSAGSGWYRITLPNVTSAGVVFSDNGSPQSQDLTVGGENCFTRDFVDDCSQRVIDDNPLTQNSFDHTPEGNIADLSDAVARMHWVEGETLVWNGLDSSQYTTRLYHSADAELVVTDQGLFGEGNYLPLSGTQYADFNCDPADDTCKFGYLDGPAFTFSGDLSGNHLRELVKHQLVAVAYDSNGNLAHYDRVQLPGALDDLFADQGAYEADLGVIYNGNEVKFNLWAPLSRDVSLMLYDADQQFLESVPMSENRNTGIWSVTMDRSAVDRQFFRYHHRVFRFDDQVIHAGAFTDPYSVSLSTNSRFSQVVDLRDSDLQPSGWDGYERPVIQDPTDLIIYEAHVRDFSARDQSTLQASPSGQDYRGKYRAFTLDHTAPMTHLQSLADAGLNMLHLLPVNNLGSIDEDQQARADVTDTLGTLCDINPNVWVCDEFNHSTPLVDVFSSFDPTTTDANDLWEEMRFIDGYNWGYDPFHFFAPEGSYATDPDGTTAILELRELIQNTHEMGLTVALDVVYNHTFRAGLEDKSVLDRAVPGYYHRLNAFTGEIENSTCCPNTATEFSMMEKLMIDSLVLWVEHYRFDAFRFDLMGHIPLAAGLRAREAVQAVHPTNYFYGEGWNFGEVANNERFFQASQLNKAGTGIGTFSDRLRQAVREGSVFDGFDNHPLNVVRYGLAGNLQSYELTIDGSSQIRGEDYLWNGNITGYSLQPYETVTYVSKHDNPTLWDNFHETLPGLTNPERTAIQQVALAYPLLAQGIPFIHMGSELLRSKSMDRDSYDSGDWFNLVDFTRQTNNWNVGLPSCEKNSLSCGGEDRWPMISDRIAASPIGPDTQQIDQTNDWMQALLSMRSSSKLFRLPNTASIEDRLVFHNTGSNPLPGLVVMSVDDGFPRSELDPNHDAVVALFNSYDQAHSFTIGDAAGKGFELHPAIHGGLSAANATVDDSTGTFTVPARTVAVFVIPRGAGQGPGLSGSISGDHAGVAFTCENGNTDWGDSVYVVGDIPELGNWDIAEGVVMGADNWPTWELALNNLPTHTDIEWKCVMRSESDPNDPTAVWQGGANNTVQTGGARSVMDSTGSF